MLGSLTSLTGGGGFTGGSAGPSSSDATNTSRGGDINNSFGSSFQVGGAGNSADAGQSDKMLYLIVAAVAVVWLIKR